MKTLPGEFVEYLVALYSSSPTEEQRGQLLDAFMAGATVALTLDSVGDLLAARNELIAYSREQVKKHGGGIIH